MPSSLAFLLHSHLYKNNACAFTPTAYSLINQWVIHLMFQLILPTRSWPIFSLLIEDDDETDGVCAATAAADNVESLFICSYYFIIGWLLTFFSSFSYGFLPHLKFKFILLFCDFWQFWDNTSYDPSQPQDISSQCWFYTVVSLVFRCNLAYVHCFGSSPHRVTAGWFHKQYHGIKVHSLENKVECWCQVMDLTSIYWDLLWGECCSGGTLVSKNRTSLCPHEIGHPVGETDTSAIFMQVDL